jgi:hypothetical protein
MLALGGVVVRRRGGRRPANANWFSPANEFPSLSLSARHDR